MRLGRAAADLGHVCLGVGHTLDDKGLGCDFVGASAEMQRAQGEVQLSGECSAVQSVPHTPLRPQRQRPWAPCPRDLAQLCQVRGRM